MKWGVRNRKNNGIKHGHVRKRSGFTTVECRKYNGEPKTKFMCTGCGKEAESSYPHTRFCSTACRKKSSPWASNYKGLPTGSIGAIGELRASADLLAKGYEVFRALSAHCSCDLAILKDRRLLRIEVRTGQINLQTGTRSTPKPKEVRYDVLCIVFPDGIEYQPPLDEINGTVQPTPSAVPTHFCRS
jgi:hypothetical protein